LLNLDFVLCDQGFSVFELGSDFELHAADIGMISANVFRTSAEKKRAGGIVSFFG